MRPKALASNQWRFRAIYLLPSQSTNSLSFLHRHTSQLSLFSFSFFLSQLVASTMADGRDPNAQLLHELDVLSHSLYQSHTARRTASLVLPRSSAAAPSAGAGDVSRTESRPRSRRTSMSPWRSRPKSENEPENDEADDGDHRHHRGPPAKQQSLPGMGEAAEKKGIWSWKPMRALSHIGMQRLGCLFSVEVVAIQGLPATMNGLRLSVAVRKKETKEGALQTMPARVLQGSVDFEETLFIRCHVYCSGGAGAGKPLKFESRTFLISVVAIDAPELDLGRSSVDLSQLVKESMEKSFEGARVRQWDATFPLSGKAKGGELVLKLGFQIMEDGGVALYKQADSGGAAGSSKFRETTSFSFPRKKASKSSFSMSSPKITRSEPSSTPTKEASTIDLKEIDEFNLDDPAPLPEQKDDDLDLPEFDVVEKGVEIQAAEEHQAETKPEEEETESVAMEEEASASSEVVKEVVHDSAHLCRLTELDAIAQQIKALESIMVADELNPVKEAQEDGAQRLEAEEDAVTREFLQMLELEDENEEQRFSTLDNINTAETEIQQKKMDLENGIFISDLGKGLGSVVQTRDGGYLCSMNPFDMPVTRKETLKLAMQISKPFILKDQKLTSGFEVFQKLASTDAEELGAKLQSLTSMDELIGKTAEQIAFEGMASAIICGRNKEGASSSAAKTVALLKTMAAALSEGRKERILTGIWNVREEPVTVEEILAFALHKMEVMAVEALKIQAGMAEEEAPFDVSSLLAKADKHPLDSAVPPEGWEATSAGANSLTFLVVIQLRDPLRRYENVGAPSIAVIQAARVDEPGEDGDPRFKVSSLHVGGMRLRAGARRSVWGGEKQRLTAMQWLVAYGLGKAGKKKAVQAKSAQDALWSSSSRVMADMWLKPMRNPDVKFPEL